MAYPVQEYVALVDGSGNLVGLPGTSAQGRLTLTTAVPVLTASVTAAATVYYTPYLGNFVPLYDGTVVMPTEFTELSNVLANSSVGSAGPAAGAAAENYDMFVWNNGGTLTLTRGPVWTNATTRSAGTVLVRVKGVLLNNAAITNGPAAQRGTYVGTIHTDAATATVTVKFTGAATDGTQFVWLGVWNMYNRVAQACESRDTEASWTYSSATVHSANGDNGNRISVVRGLDEDPVDVEYSVAISTAVLGSFGLVGVGLDVTNAISGRRGQVGVNPAVATVMTGMAISSYNALPGLGFHFFQAVEAADGTNNATFTGNQLTAQGIKGTFLQ